MSDNVRIIVSKGALEDFLEAWYMMDNFMGPGAEDCWDIISERHPRWEEAFGAIYEASR